MRYSKKQNITNEYTIIPNRMWRILSGNELRIAGLIMSYPDNYKITINGMASELGINWITVKNNYNSLLSKKIFIVEDNNLVFNKELIESKTMLPSHSQSSHKKLCDEHNENYAMTAEGVCDDSIKNYAMTADNKEERNIKEDNKEILKKENFEIKSIVELFRDYPKNIKRQVYSEMYNLVRDSYYSDFNSLLERDNIPRRLLNEFEVHYIKSKQSNYNHKKHKDIIRTLLKTIPNEITDNIILKYKERK